VEIRRLDVATAEGAAELFRELQPSVVTTASFLLHRDAAMPERARRLSLVAVDSGSVAGWASANLKWVGGSLSDARVWVAVLPSHRRRGLGTELADRVERHAIEAGATTIVTLVENDLRVPNSRDGEATAKAARRSSPVSSLAASSHRR
jgi:GNAT superfamily N-acetyltransferase